MSIVEKAIDKLQGSRPSAHAENKTQQPDSPTITTHDRMPVPRRTLDIDQDALQDAGILVPEDARARIENEYRRIKRPLLANAFGKGAMPVMDGNLVMITSCLPGEGKTFTAVNLAFSVALERDRTVLLVDADVAKPGISRAFGSEGAPGLIDLLLDDKLSVGDVLVHTNMDNLKLLPAGQKHRHATELLASERMEQLAREIGQRYSDRFVIFDSPPLLATAEAQVLAGLLGQIVLVVEANRTSESAVQEALEHLNSAQAVNLVLNKSREPGSDYYGGYYGSGSYSTSKSA